VKRRCSVYNRTESFSGSGRRELRPYGKGGALVCFDCGMKDLETTNVEFGKRLDAAGPVAVLTPDGPKKMKGGES